MAKKIELNDEQNKAIATATAALQNAAGTFAHVVATAALTFKEVVAEQTKALKAVGLDDKHIARVVKNAIGDACTPQNISKALNAAGIRLRGKRSDKGTARALTGAAKNAVNVAFLPKKPEEKEEKEPKGWTVEQILNAIKNSDATVQRGVVTSPLVQSLLEQAEVAADEPTAAELAAAEVAAA